MSSYRREEWRPEVCPECLAGRERSWTVMSHKPGVTAIPRGAHVEPASVSIPGGLGKQVAVPSRYTTLCLCDAG